MTDALVAKQKNKPHLTKKMEGTDGNVAELRKKLLSAKDGAMYIVSKANNNDFATCDSFEAEMCWANIISRHRRGPWVLQIRCLLWLPI